MNILDKESIRVSSSPPGPTPAQSNPCTSGFQTGEISHLPHQRQPQAQHAFSPDTVSSELLTADLASTRWLDLLATDAAQANSGFSLAPSPSARPASLASAGPDLNLNCEATRPADLEAAHRQANRIVSESGLGPSVPVVRDSACELQAWQLDQEICLQDEEAILLRTFTEGAALLLDLFDQQKHFSTHATRLAVSESQRTHACPSPARQNAVR